MLPKRKRNWCLLRFMSSILFQKSGSKYIQIDMVKMLRLLNVVHAES